MGNVLGEWSGELNPRGVRMREGHSNHGGHGAPEEHRTFWPFSQCGVLPHIVVDLKSRNYFPSVSARQSGLKSRGPFHISLSQIG